MSELPPRRLYERLREVTGASSDEDLARAINVGLKTVTRLKAGHGVEYERAIRLLGLAGWLRTDGQDGEELDAVRLRYLANRAKEAADELLERLEAGQVPPRD